MEKLKNEIVKELHDIENKMEKRGGLKPDELDLAYRLACTYHYLDKINDAEHLLAQAEKCYKDGMLSEAKVYLHKAKPHLNTEILKDWYADLDSKLTKSYL